jgi:hypothetical protein
MVLAARVWTDANCVFDAQLFHTLMTFASALEPSSKPPVRIVEDNVAASLHQQRTFWAISKMREMAESPENYIN